eukprot:5193364-Amphidinium_carterae.1
MAMEEGSSWQVMKESLLGRKLWSFSSKVCVHSTVQELLVDEKEKLLKRALITVVSLVNGGQTRGPPR